MFIFIIYIIYIRERCILMRQLLKQNQIIYVFVLFLHTVNQILQFSLRRIHSMGYFTIAYSTQRTRNRKWVGNAGLGWEIGVDMSWKFPTHFLFFLLISKFSFTTNIFNFPTHFPQFFTKKMFTYSPLYGTDFVVSH
jgi:hypothetical protein